MAEYGKKDDSTQAEFLELTGKKVLGVFFFAIHSHLYLLILLPSTPWAKVVWNWFVM